MTKKYVTREQINYAFFGSNLAEFIERLQELSARFSVPLEEIKIEYDSHYGDYSEDPFYKISAQTLETDSEYQVRTEKEHKVQKANEVREREMFEKLKLKYDK